jgi:ABC-2 type transport system ATP-binding protein
MNAICGVRRPSAGVITVAGHDMYGRDLRARAMVGYLPERPPLYVELTVREYLTFCARLRGIARRERPRAVDRAIDTCNLGSVRERVIGNLSKGFQQRVGIAQAIVHRPSVLVLDEPTVGLDPGQIGEIRTFIRELARDQGVLLSTHILGEVEATCDEVMVLHEGRLVMHEHLTHLARDDAEHRIRVTWARAPSTADLSRLDGVLDAEPVDGQAVEIRCADPEAAIRAVMRESLARGWSVQALVPSRRSLEATFLALTRHDPLSPGHERP